MKIFFLSLPDKVGYSAPLNAGLDAKMIVYPADATPGNEKISATFVFFNKEAQESMQMDNEGLLEYAKSVFFATAAPASENKVRSVMGKELKTEIIKKNIPIPSTLEIVLIEGQAMEKVVLGVVSAGLSTEEYEQKVTELMRSLGLS